MAAEILTSDICVYFDLETLHVIWRTCKTTLQLRRQVTVTRLVGGGHNRLIAKFRGRMLFYMSVDAGLLTMIVSITGVPGTTRIIPIIYSSTRPCILITDQDAIFGLSVSDAITVARVHKILNYNSVLYKATPAIWDGIGIELEDPRDQTLPRLFLVGSTFYERSNDTCPTPPHYYDALLLTKIEHGAQ